MSKHKKYGFTLVELLAVIVILAVILVIAVPQIISTITESRKGAFASSAKLIASMAETKKLSNDTLGIDTNIECSDVVQLTSEDYTSCSIKFVDGKAQVKIIGKGKFEGMAVCGGTKEDAEVVDKCPTAVQTIESLATESNTKGLATDDFVNIRYVGGSEDVKNYIKFNDEDWRIIGIFEVTTSSGKTEKLVKIVKDTPFSTRMSWDSSASSVNGGYGVNEWSQADLMTMLNTYYIGENTTCSYCSRANQEICSNDCSSSVTPIGNTYRSMIEEVVWNTGAISYSNSISRSSAYSQERVNEIGANGEGTGKTCSSDRNCNDSVTRTITWTGKVGLIYPSDYGYASTSGTDINNYAIGTTNWLNSGSNYWTMSPYAFNGYASLACGIYFGDSDNLIAFNKYGVRPAIYLKSNVSITSGDGSSSNPYQLGM